MHPPTDDMRLHMNVCTLLLLAPRHLRRHVRLRPRRCMCWARRATPACLPACPLRYLRALRARLLDAAVAQPILLPHSNNYLSRSGCGCGADPVARMCRRLRRLPLQKAPRGCPGCCGCLCLRWAFPVFSLGPDLCSKKQQKKRFCSG